MKLDFGLAFEPSTTRLQGEREDRKRLVAQRLRFNIDFLDDALGGILPNDLVVLGARTGAGKTALASMIAQSNARIGKRVHYFALEAEPREIERRMKYRALIGIAWPMLPPPARARFNYRAWYLGELDDLLGGELDERANAKLATFKTLHTYYRGESFTIDTLDRTFRAIQDQTDLIILDHLHYVDTDDPNENRGYKEITKRIRDISLSVGVPIIVISHLRKKERGPLRVVPDIDDFHGTSEVVKMATKVILIAPAPRSDGSKPHLWGTYMHVPKDRMDGTTQRYVARGTFDVRRGIYTSGYDIGFVSVDGTQWTKAEEHEVPRWALRQERFEESEAAQ